MTAKRWAEILYTGLTNPKAIWVPGASGDDDIATLAVQLLQDHFDDSQICFVGRELANMFANSELPDGFDPTIINNTWYCFDGTDIVHEDEKADGRPMPNASIFVYAYLPGRTPDEVIMVIFTYHEWPHMGVFVVEELPALSRVSDSQPYTRSQFEAAACEATAMLGEDVVGIDAMYKIAYVTGNMMAYYEHHKDDLVTYRPHVSKKQSKKKASKLKKLRELSKLNIRVIDIPGKNTHPDGAISYAEGVRRKISAHFLVRGHWRNQAHGPGMTQRKYMFIAPYFKGPVDGRKTIIVNQIKGATP